jgi:hypothetical protein
MERKPQKKQMELRLKLDPGHGLEPHHCTASRIRIDGKGNLILYGDRPAFSESVPIRELREISIAWTSPDRTLRKFCRMDGLLFAPRHFRFSRT